MKLAIFLLSSCFVTIKGCDGKETKIPIPCPSPSPISSPSPLPSPEISPIPEPVPSPIPSPSASPKPSPLPLPSPSPFPSPAIPTWCKIESDGNFGEAPLDQCPQCWTDYAESNDVEIISRWGIAFRLKRPCKGTACGCGVVVNVDVTPHSKKPFLAHRRTAGGSETHKGCQPSNDSSMVPEIWVYPPRDVAGLCDPFSGDNYWCHHKAKAGTCGSTKFEVQHGDKASIIVNVP